MGISRLTGLIWCYQVLVPERDLVLLSLRSIVVEEFSLGIARIWAPFLQHAVFGTDFSGLRRDVGWNASFFGDAGRKEEHRYQMTSIAQQFLMEHTGSLQSLELHSLFDWNNAYVITFRALCALTIKDSSNSVTPIIARDLESLYLSNEQQRTDGDDLTHTFLTPKAITLFASRVTYLLCSPVFESTTESITIIVRPPDLTKHLSDILELLQALGDRPAELHPCLEHLTFKFEGHPPLIGIHNWGKLSVPFESGSRSGYR